jgi:hypothetical protein
MIRTVTSPYTKLYIPARICPSGRHLMSVNRNDLLRYVSLRDVDEAQHTIDALRNGDIVHVTGEILTRKVARPEDGDMIVWETSVDAIMRMAGPQNFGVDVCEFVGPNFVVLEAVYVSPRKRSKDDKQLLEDMLKL